MDGKLRTLQESKEFEKQINELGDIKNIDEALRILTCSIAFNPDPEAFPFVPGFNNIQIAKTDEYIRGDNKVPPLRLWFRVVSDDLVELMSIERYEKIDQF